MDVPQNPIVTGDLICHQEGMDVRIGDTVPGKELTWLKFRDGDQIIWICDRNLIKGISRKECDALIQDVTLEGQDFIQTLPKAGRGSRWSFRYSMWNRMIECLKNPERDLHVKYCYSHTLQHTEWDAGIFVGYYHAGSWVDGGAAPKFDALGWRPVLEENKGTDGVEDYEASNHDRRPEIHFVEKKKCFSLYVNDEAVGVPKAPSKNGDLIKYDDNKDIRIGETVLGDELTWLVFRDDKCTYMVCDRNLVNGISRFDCGYLTGVVILDGKTFFQSLPIAGIGTDQSFQNSEWSRMIRELNDPEKMLHTENCSSHAFLRSKEDDAVLIQPESWSCCTLNVSDDSYGWRPVLLLYDELNTIDQEILKLAIDIDQFSLDHEFGPYGSYDDLYDDRFEGFEDTLRSIMDNHGTDIKEWLTDIIDGDYGDHYSDAMDTVKSLLKRLEDV